MWLLLTESGIARALPRRAAAATPTRSASRAVGGDARMSADAVVSKPSGITLAEEGDAQIFMHPGRMPVGRVSFARLGVQFDLEGPEVFPTIDAAEADNVGVAGFLLVLDGRIIDAAGNTHAGGVLFCRRLR
jgi:hypothetical protein